MTAEEYSSAYQRGFNLAVRFFLSRGVSYDDAVESVQAAWAKGWERREQLRDSNCITAWIISIARNLRNTTLKQHLRESAAGEPWPSSRAYDVLALDAKEILDRCDRQDRAILEAHYLQGFTVRQIAAAENISQGAANARLVRARKHAKPVSHDRDGLRNRSLC